MNRNSEKKSLNRRNFLAAGAGGIAGAALAVPSNARARVFGANDRINIGVIGCGGRAGGLMESMAGFIEEENFTFTALCDVWKVNLEKKALWVKKLTGKKPKTFSRYQDLLALKEVDAVMICTPDHGHSPILIAACDVGKDVFCEKPMSMNIEEAREAVDAVRRNGSIVQIGTQRRSQGNFMAAAGFIQSGKLGKVSVIDLKWNDAGPRWRRSYTDVRPEEVDWEGYLMHLPPRQFDPRRYRCWHLYRDYSIGLVGLLGAHLTDLVHWYMDDPYPASVTAQGGTLVWKNREHYDTIICTYKYPKDFIVTYESRLCNSSMRSESVFYGTQGILAGNTISSEGRVPPDRAEPTGKQYPTSPLSAQDGDGKPSEITLEPAPGQIDHMRNWVQCVRERKTPNATVEHGYSHSIAAIMGHLAADTGKHLVYDPVKREIKEG